MRLILSRGYSILFRPAFADPSSSLLRLNFTKASWPLFFRRITEPCRPADSLDSLVWILADAIQGTLTESSIFPVVDRHEELRAKVNKQPLSPTSLNALGQTQTLSPSDMASYDPAQAHHTAREYTAALASFNAHLSSRSALYNLITSNPSRPESKILTPSTHPPLTVFILSLLSSPPFLKQLQSDALRMQIEERIRDDLRDGRIRREVEIIRRQMESLETCCKEECGPTCRVEGGCAK